VKPQTAISEEALPEAAAGELAAETSVVQEAKAPQLREERIQREAPRVERHERRDFKPAPPAAVAEAIEEVNEIIASLKLVLDQMEEILETLELAEVQKTADEREIQSLRSALRQLDRRGAGGRQEPHRSPEREREGGEPRGPESRRRDDRRHSRSEGPREQ
jgi:hypothetical protein